jgi:hypothetical protein
MPIDREVMRSYLLEAFRRTSGTQVEILKYDVGKAAAD